MVPPRDDSNHLEHTKIQENSKVQGPEMDSSIGELNANHGTARQKGEAVGWRV